MLSTEVISLTKKTDMQKLYNFPTFDEMTSDPVHPVEPNVDENVVARSEDRRIASVRIILIRSVDTV